MYSWLVPFRHPSTSPTIIIKNSESIFLCIQVLDATHIVGRTHVPTMTRVGILSVCTHTLRRWVPLPSFFCSVYPLPFSPLLTTVDDQFPSLTVELPFFYNCPPHYRQRITTVQTITGILPPMTPITQDMYTQSGVNWYKSFDNISKLAFYFFTFQAFSAFSGFHKKSKVRKWKS